MKQIITIEAENDVNIDVALGEMDCTLEEFDVMSIVGWKMVLDSVGKIDDVKKITVKTLR